MNPLEVVDFLGEPDQKYIGGNNALLSYPFGYVDWYYPDSIRYTFYIDKNAAPEQIKKLLGSLEQCVMEFKKEIE